MSRADPENLDPRFSLANERTFLAWIRTALALIAGGVAAAKALHFHHELWRWTVAGPPIAAGVLIAFEATQRWRAYEQAMQSGRPLPVGRGLQATGVLLAAYALLALAASALEG